MKQEKWFEWRLKRKRQAPRAQLQLELLETRSLLSTSLGLTPLVQVSDPSPLDNTIPPHGTVFLNSEVEPQIAVDPTNPAHAVAVWQQDRYRSVGGGRALVASVTYDAGASWSAPAAIPGFNAAVVNPAYGRYTDPWVTITPSGDVYASAIGLTVSGHFPLVTAVLVVKSTDGGKTWSDPTTLREDQAPAGTLQVNEANDKEMIAADPNDSTGRTAYVVWDQLDFPSDTADFEAFHANAAIRENAFYSKTTDGGATWTPAQNMTNFLDLQSAFGNQLIIEPDHTLADVFTLFNGSGKQPNQAGKTSVAVIRSTDGGQTWSAPIIGPAVQAMSVTDPNTGAPVRDGEFILSVTADHNGTLYAVWADGRFSNFTHEDIAFSTSADGGLTWSAPIKVNQTPTTIPAGDQQAFTPAVAVNSDGTVAVTYYDFRNNGTSPGLATDYWLVHADPASGLTNPASWQQDEKRLTSLADGTTGAPFNMENAAPTSRGYFLGDYQGLAAAGTSFYALFGQAGSGASDPSNIWFRDPPAVATAAAPQREGDVSAAHRGASAQPFAANGLSEDLGFLYGVTRSLAGQGYAPEGNQPRTDDFHSGSGPASKHWAALPTNNDFDLAFLSASATATTSLDFIFADSGDALFSEALGSDGAPPPID